MKSRRHAIHHVIHKSAGNSPSIDHRASVAEIVYLKICTPVARVPVANLFGGTATTRSGVDCDSAAIVVQGSFGARSVVISVG